MRLLLVVALSLVVSASAGHAAEAPVCALAALEDQYEAADAAFVGRLVSDRPAGDGARVHRFAVERVLKGPIGAAVDVSAPPLTDRDGTPLERGVPVGVLAELDGARFETTSCGLIEPASLVTASEPQRGQGLKLAIGLVIALLVLVFALMRLRRRPGRSGEPRGAAPQSDS